MRRLCVFAILGLVAVALNANSGFARLPYRKQFEETYKDSKIVEAAKEAKCNVCHYGKTKKNRNDYGKALTKYLNADQYKKLYKTDKEALNKKIKEALKSVVKVKSTKGKTFGELIKAGQLPGTVPETEDEPAE